MNKLFKLFCIIIVIILFSTISLSSSIKKDLETPDLSTGLENSDSKNLELGSNNQNTTNIGDNVLISYETEVIEDADQDNILDSYGDQDYSYEDAKKKFGISYELKIYDSSGNSKLDIGETTHAKLVIKNNSEKDYILQQIRIDAKAGFFGENAFSNIITKNTGNASYYFEDNLLKSNGEAYKIPSKSTATYEWDILWTNDDKEMAQKYLAEDAEAYDFINVEFIVYTGDESAIYYMLGNQDLKLSGDVIK